MPDVVKFVRQLSHDLRNHLNAAELQSAYLAEIAEDPELKEEIKRLRAMISEVGSKLATRHLSLEPGEIDADALWRGRFRRGSAPEAGGRLSRTKARRSNGACKPGDATLKIDPQSLQPALLELFANAFRHDRAEGAHLRSRRGLKETVSSSRSANRSEASNARPKTGDASRCDSRARPLWSWTSSGARYHRGSRRPTRRAL